MQTNPTLEERQRLSCQRACGDGLPQHVENQRAGSASGKPQVEGIARRATPINAVETRRCRRLQSSAGRHVIRSLKVDPEENLLHPATQVPLFQVRFSARPVISIK